MDVSIIVCVQSALYVHMSNYVHDMHLALYVHMSNYVHDMHACMHASGR